MSTDTPAQTPQAPTYWQAKLEMIRRAIQAWQNSDDESSDESSDASTLEDALLDHGLQLLPRAITSGCWLVLIDGQPAPTPGGRPAGPVDAEEAAEIFLLAAAQAEAEGRTREIVMRPATDSELVRHAIGGGL
ncbi:hypothetical protein OG884_06140 [Streptosporangium sp. NBC_01755]|uniref:hypothetical protein n=1 Tax=Streptosporangium sp. NBC_01755 TaxID=2975949 RepID=UPI002DD7AB4C|nr:hypothetical protein [Streptosporangium sp. NBC_01755]WSD01507.1 hypothetical protein OG884_06140 [Streptosporangium sp. NBC_01755]